jgi:hypothetical protein
VAKAHEEAVKLHEAAVSVRRDLHTNLEAGRNTSLIRAAGSATKAAQKASTAAHQESLKVGATPIKQTGSAAPGTGGRVFGGGAGGKRIYGNASTPESRAANTLTKFTNSTRIPPSRGQHEQAAVAHEKAAKASSTSAVRGYHQSMVAFHQNQARQLKTRATWK